MCSAPYSWKVGQVMVGYHLGFVLSIGESGNTSSDIRVYVCFLVDWAVAFGLGYTRCRLLAYNLQIETRRWV